MATTAAPGKEVRVTGIAERLLDQRRRAWESGNRPIAAARWASAGWHTLAWAIFGAGYVGAIVFVVSGLGAPAGDVLLTLAAGSRLSFYVGATVGEIGFLRGIWMDAARRLAWLEDYAASLSATADQPAPDRLIAGIRFDHVSFAYPGTDRLVLDDVTSRSARGHSDRDRRRKRSGQVDARQAAGEDVRADTAVASSSTTRTSRELLSSTGARVSPAPSRISSASSSAPVRPSEWAICRAWMTNSRL